MCLVLLYGPPSRETVLCSDAIRPSVRPSFPTQTHKFGTQGRRNFEFHGKHFLARATDNHIFRQKVKGEGFTGRLKFRLDADSAAILADSEICSGCHADDGF